MNNHLSELYRDIFNRVECDIGNHYFIRYNESTLICKRCGRFAMIGYLPNKEEEDA